MQLATWLNEASDMLAAAGIATGRLDAEVLLSDAIRSDRSWILAHPEYNLNSRLIKALSTKLSRRSQHEPLAYIRGKQEFYGLEFFVTPDTLTPRPETESMVSQSLKLMASNDIASVADVGTGSGCILISIAANHTRSAVNYTGYDISKKALAVARKNQKKHAVNVAFALMDITTVPLLPAATLVVANLPYVPDDFHINLAASREPALAIFGGKDGLDYYRRLFEIVAPETKWVITESLPPQHAKLIEIANHAGFLQQLKDDFIQVFSRDSVSPEPLQASPIK